MNAKLVNEIVNAVLYEGYILYPYRPSSVKNRQRFNFGVFAPRDYCEKHASGETYFLQSECLVRGSPGAELIVNLRFLHVAARIVNRLTTPVTDLSEANRWNLHPWILLMLMGEFARPGKKLSNAMSASDSLWRS